MWLQLWVAGYVERGRIKLAKIQKAKEDAKLWEARCKQGAILPQRAISLQPVQMPMTPMPQGVEHCEQCGVQLVRTGHFCDQCGEYRDPVQNTEPQRRFTDSQVLQVVTPAPAGLMRAMPSKRRVMPATRLVTTTKLDVNKIQNYKNSGGVSNA